MCEIVCAVLRNNCCQVTSAESVQYEQLCDGRLTNSQCPWDVCECNDGLICCFLGL